jgi:hypothetical protein
MLLLQELCRMFCCVLLRGLLLRAPSLRLMQVLQASAAAARAAASIARIG